MEDSHKKLTREERRLLWKDAKKKKREENKAYYQYAPWLSRVWNLYLKKPILAILIIAVLISVVSPAVTELWEEQISPLLSAAEWASKDNPLSAEDLPKIYEASPIDESGAARIDALPSVGKEETWTICVYLVGADLEDAGENDLSYVSFYLTRDLKAENQERSSARRAENVIRFTEELSANGLELLAFFYYPEKPVASSTFVTDDVIVSDRMGAASADIAEMTSGIWSDRYSSRGPRCYSVYRLQQSSADNRQQRFPASRQHGAAEHACEL